MWWIIFFHRIHHFHRISYINLPQKSMRWIFVRNAVNFSVNFCKKCREMRWNIYFHRNHHISYKDSPHFLQKFTQKPRPRVKKISQVYDESAINEYLGEDKERLHLLVQGEKTM